MKIDFTRLYVEIKLKPDAKKGAQNCGSNFVFEIKVEEMKLP
jgi:hypothetical protein